MGFSGLLKAMQGNPAAHRLVAPVANRFFGKADREASGVLSAALASYPLPRQPAHRRLRRHV